MCLVLASDARPSYVVMGGHLRYIAYNSFLTHILECGAMRASKTFESEYGRPSAAVGKIYPQLGAWPLGLWARPLDYWYHQGCFSTVSALSFLVLRIEDLKLLVRCQPLLQHWGSQHAELFIGGGSDLTDTSNAEQSLLIAFGEAVACLCDAIICTDVRHHFARGGISKYCTCSRAPPAQPVSVRVANGPRATRCTTVRA